MALITLNDYAAKYGRSPATVRQKVYRGGFKTAQKIGRQIFIDENEPYVDERITSGDYIGFNQGYAGWKKTQRRLKQEQSPEAIQAAAERETKAQRHERLEKRKAILDTVRELGISTDEAIDLIKK